MEKKKPRKSKYTTPAFRKKLRRAIEGSGGIKKVIADKLGLPYMTVWKIIDRAPQGIKDMIEKEKEFMGDVAEQTVLESMQQRLDIATASRTALRVLNSNKHKKRGYSEDNKLTIEGGDKPLKVQNEAVLDIDTLDLPIKTRKQILKAMEKKALEDSNGQ